MKTCKICEDTYFSNGYCRYHYSTVHRYKKRDLKNYKQRPKWATPEEWFWGKTVKVGDCLESLFRSGSHGYGQINFQGKVWTCHTLAYTLVNGSIPKGMFVCHSCDNRLCMEPNHLFLGTQADNMADMVSKGRSLKGEQVHWAKLTENEVKEILDSNLTRKELAKIYGVSYATIAEVQRREIWKHVR